MSGFLGTSTAMTVCKAEGKYFDLEKLRANAFSTAVNPDGIRIGWVGMGDMLDTDSFALATVSGTYAGFSLRIDTKKPSGAVIKLKLAEAIRDEIARNGKIGGKRKKELKEAITANVAARTEFVPTIVDCIWDVENGLLFASVASAKAMQPVITMIKNTFGVEPEPVCPGDSIGAVFASVLKDGEYQLGVYRLTSAGTASLASPENAEEKAAVAVQNNASAASTAMADGLAIKKIQLVATSETMPDVQISFTLDTTLAVTGLKFPKPEKGAEEDAVFLVNADTCAQVAAMMQHLAA